MLPARTPLDLFFHLEFLHWKATAAALPMTEVTERGRRHVSESRGSSLPRLASIPFPPSSEQEGKRASLIIVCIRLRGMGGERPKDDNGGRGGLVKSTAFPRRDSPLLKGNEESLSSNDQF